MSIHVRDEIREALLLDVLLALAFQAFAIALLGAAFSPVGEIELQRTRKDTGRSPVLPSPWARPPVSATR